MNHTFFADTHGNIALLSAAALAPLCLCIGLAVDFTTISRVKSELQQGVDSAALAVAREGSEISDSQATRNRGPVPAIECWRRGRVANRHA